MGTPRDPSGDAGELDPYFDLDRDLDAVFSAAWVFADSAGAEEAARKALVDLARQRPTRSEVVARAVRHARADQHRQPHRDPHEPDPIVDAALALRRRLREPLLLADGAGLSDREIAVVLGSTRRSVRRRIETGRRRIAAAVRKPSP